MRSVLIHTQKLSPDAAERLEFAIAPGMTALCGIASEWGYEIIGVDVPDAFVAVVATARAVGVDEAVVEEYSGVDCSPPATADQFNWRMLWGSWPIGDLDASYTTFISSA